MLHNLLNKYEIILASKSPRRKNIFDQLGFSYKQEPSHIKEIPLDLSPINFAKHYAQEKVKKVSRKNPKSLIVGADTIVMLNNEILGKPSDIPEAKKYLKLLSHKMHVVITGVSIYLNNKIYSKAAQTNVYFNKLSLEDIDEYVKTNEPMDKAGSYGIQGYGSQFIIKIEGCYFNVMGFPVSLFYDMCKKIL